jgi:hypothetical protein
MCTARLPVVEWTEPPPPSDLNGLVRLAERRKLVSARVPSHFKRSLAPKHLCHVVHDSEVQDKVAPSTTSVPNHYNFKQAYSAPDTVQSGNCIVPPVVWPKMGKITVCGSVCVLHTAVAPLIKILHTSLPLTINTAPINTDALSINECSGQANCGCHNSKRENSSFLLELELPEFWTSSHRSLLNILALPASFLSLERGQIFEPTFLISFFVKYRNGTLTLKQIMTTFKFTIYT